MKDKNNKDTWQKPELIVLVRNKPEEAVLAACKGPAISGPRWGGGIGCIHQNQGPCHESGIS